MEGVVAGLEAQAVFVVEVEPLRRLADHFARHDQAAALLPEDLQRLVAVEHGLHRLADQAFQVEIGEHRLDLLGHAGARLVAVKPPFQRLDRRLAAADAAADVGIGAQFAVQLDAATAGAQDRVRVGQVEAERGEIDGAGAQGDVFGEFRHVSSPGD